MVKKIQFIFLVFIIGLFFSYTIYAASFTPRISISEEYNDNIYLDEEDQHADWITLISPGFFIETRARKIGASLDYGLAHSIYQTYSENDTYRHDAFFDFWLKLAKHTEVGLSNSFIKTEDPISEDDSFSNESPLVVRSSRQPYYSNSASVDIQHIFGENRSLNLEYRYDILENEDNDVEDNESHNGSLVLNYNFVPHLGVETDISYTNGIYDISDNFVEWQARTRLTKTVSNTVDIFIEYSHSDFNSEAANNRGDYRIYNPSAGTSWTFGDGGTFSINTGYFVQERNGADNESGLTIDGNLGKQWRFRHGLINISGNSGYEDSQLDNENLGFNVYYQTVAGAEYSFSRNFRSTIGLSYRHDDYTNQPEDQPERKDKNYTADASLVWQVKQWLDINLNYQYQNRDSSVNVEDYIENRVILTLSLIHR